MRKVSRRATITRALVGLWTAAGLGASVAPAAGAERAARVGVNDRQLVVEPATPGVGMTVAVVCADGAHLRRELTGPGVGLVDLIDADGEMLGGGSCNYEVRVHPALDREALRAARASGDADAVGRLTSLERERTTVVRGRIVRIDGVTRAVPDADGAAGAEPRDERGDEQ